VEPVFKPAVVLTVDLNYLENFVVDLETRKQMEAGSFPLPWPHMKHHGVLASTYPTVVSQWVWEQR